ncbi:MAG: SCO family protein [Desulfuromonas sp.]|nr:MAG: SCO family protein [Desulfuromonas sp.]
MPPTTTSPPLCCAFIIIAMMLVTLTLPAIAEENHSHASPDNVGLDERLGALLPLDLTFTDEKGQQHTLRELVTGPTLILPIYYKCPNVCNFMQAGVASVLKDVGREAGKDYHVISISFDETETVHNAQSASRLYRGLAGEQFPDRAWTFLIGQPEAFSTFLDAAGYHFMRQGVDFVHPVVSFVIDKDGRLIRYLHGVRPLPKDLTLAFFEAEKGRAGATIRTMVQYCFSYDPQQKTYVFNLLRVSATAILATLGIFLAFLVFGGKKKKKGSHP